MQAYINQWAIPSFNLQVKASSKEHKLRSDLTMDMSHSEKLLKGGSMGDYIGDY